MVAMAGRTGVRAQKKKGYSLLWGGRADELRKQAKFQVKTGM